MDKPNLIEKNVYDHVIQSLLLCHTNRIQKYSFIINSCCLFICISFFLCLFYLCWKNRSASAKKYQKYHNSHEYITTTIRNRQIESAKKNTTPITNLPIIINELNSR